MIEGEISYLSLVHLFLENELVGEGSESVPSSFVELVLELHPVKSEGVKEAFQCVHTHQHEECE